MLQSMGSHMLDRTEHTHTHTHTHTQFLNECGQIMEGTGNRVPAGALGQQCL